MKKPVISLASTLLPTKVELPESDKNFELENQKVETVYPGKKTTFERQTARLTAEIPYDLYRKIKIHCFQEGILVKDYLTEVLERAEEGGKFIK